MAESGEREEIAPRGNDWEVVSLTASAYAAAPGPKGVEEIVGDKESASEENKVETSQALFMSGHFLFPVKQTNDVSAGSEVDKSEVMKEHEIKELDSLQTGDESGRSVDKDEDIKGTATDDNLEVEVSDEKESAIGTGSAEVQRSVTQPATRIHDLSEETNVGRTISSDVKTMLSEVTSPSGEANADGSADVTSSKNGKDKKKAQSSVPCGPWWKRQAASLYDHVKEANPLWSIVITAAVMGLAVLGQRWQQRKSHVAALNLQFSANEEKPGKMLGHISRLKEAFVSGNQGSASVRSHISTQI